MNSHNKKSHPKSLSRYLITPMSRAMRCGNFSASLSVRNGQGSQAHDRIYTFCPSFPSRESALHYATEQGQNWLINPTAFA